MEERRVFDKEGNLLRVEKLTESGNWIDVEIIATP